MSTISSGDSGLRLSPASSISYLLHAIKKELQGATSGTRASTGLNRNEVDALEQDVLEILHLLQSIKNVLAPISKIPPEILILIPKFWETYDRNRDITTLTHVCQAWRETFISCSSLWTDFRCMDADKTRVYLERAKSSPINLSLNRDRDLPPNDPFLPIIPHAIGRLKSLVIQGTPENVRDITAYLSHPTPLLEEMKINGRSKPYSQDYPTLTTAFFDGDFSSLRRLSLRHVHTELPWRNMVNLTSFTLSYVSECEVSIDQFLDFFESAPSLLKVKLDHATPTSGARNGRVVPLSRLQELVVEGDDPSSLFLDHLLIPVGAKVTLEFGFNSRDAQIKDYLPRSLGNFRNLSNFTRINLYFGDCLTRLRLTGPNGRVSLLPVWEDKDYPFGATNRALQSLALFNTSTTRQLEIEGGCLPPGSTLPHLAFTLTKDIQILKLVRCQGLLLFIDALDPNLKQSDGLACPKLEELILSLDTASPREIERVAEMTAARAMRGAKLKSVHFVCPTRLPPLPPELAEHVSHVKISSGWDEAKGGSDGDPGDGDDW